MLNREVFQTDPTQYRLANDGVAKLIFPVPAGGMATLRGELETFVCEGAYANGLDRILGGFLGRAKGSAAPAAWISGFYGSGKSHLATMLAALWSNPTFDDGATAESLVQHLPSTVTAPLKELRTQGRRAGGLLAAGDTLGGGARDPVEAVLHILLRAADLPPDVRAAEVAFWLDQEDALAAVRTALGESFERDLRSFQLSPRFHAAVLAAALHVARDAGELRDLLKAQFPVAPAVTNDTLERLGRRALTLGRKAIPLTLLVLDEVQQFINQDASQTQRVQAVAETLSSRFDGRVLVVATGQQALNDMPNLQKLQGRFSIQVALGDADIDGVIRKTVLRKKPECAPSIRAMLDASAGEVSRQLQGSRLAHATSDDDDAVADWPILPSRPRAWDRVLRGLDPTGLGGTLRNQLRTTLDAASAYGPKPLGVAVPLDFFYESFAPAARNAGILPAETSAAFDKRRGGDATQTLEARVLALVYMLGLIGADAHSHGVRATPDVLADLLIEDLAGDADLRRRTPQALAALADAGLVTEVDGVWTIQTRESAEWNQAFRQAQQQVRNAPGEVQRQRAEWLTAALEEALKPLGALTQGQSREPRTMARAKGDDPSPKGALVLRIHNGWDEDLTTAEREAIEGSPQEPVLHLLIPVEDREGVDLALTRYRAADRVVQQKGPPTTEEGRQARLGIETQKRQAENLAKAAVHRAVAAARVVLSGGGEQPGTPAEAVRAAAERALKRLYTRFDEADDAHWSSALERVRKGQPDALKAVYYAGDVDKHPIARIVLDTIGPGKKGRELLEKLRAPPYGWPSDAILAVAIALANADQIETKSDEGQMLVLAEVDARKFNQVSLRRVSTVVSIAGRLKVRSLLTAAGVAFQPGGESLAATKLLEVLEAEAARSGGLAPAPFADAVPELTTLRSLGANDLLVRLAGQGEALKAALGRWRTAADEIAAREPRFRLLEALVRFGAEAQAEATDAVRTARGLLGEPDPVPPLVQAATNDLRARLNVAVEVYDAARTAGEAKVADDGVWSRLTPEQKAELRREFDLQRSGRPSVATAEEVRDALQARSLEAWRDAARAAPSHVDDLLGEAAALLEPRSQDVLLPRGLIRTEAEIDGWLAEARKRLLAKLGDGPVIPKL